VLGNADYANTIDQLIDTIREQHKEGSDFVEIYETGRDRFRDGQFTSQYQYTESQLAAAVEEAARLGTKVGVHCMGEPGALWAVQAGVESIEHAAQLSDETMRIMREKDIPAIPTFAIFEYFSDHAENPAAVKAEHELLDHHLRHFRSRSSGDSVRGRLRRQKPSSRHGSTPRPFGLWRYGDFWYLPERLFESKRVDNL
jgi:imidazolonepropionase-like amidohydrolase